MLKERVMRVPRVAVVTTYERPDVALDCIRALTDADHVVVVDNGRDKPMYEPTQVPNVPLYSLIQDDTRPPNLSRLWNLGILAANGVVDKLFPGSLQWDIAVLNDDALPFSNWFSNVARGMRTYGAVAACSGHYFHLHRSPGPVPLDTRMTGWAFVLAGEMGIMADPQFEWWFGDDDIDWRARRMGGMLMLPYGTVENRFANGYTTGERMDRTTIDAANFVAKHRMRPW